MARLVQVEAPDSALAVVTVYAKEQDVNLRAYADSLMSGIKEAVPVGKVEKNTISGDDDSLNVSYSLRLAEWRFLIQPTSLCTAWRTRM